MKKIFKSLRLFVVFLSFFGISILAVEASFASLIFFENFESGMLDPRITVGLTGTFNSAPGITDMTDFGSTKAFGFGLSTCGASCFGNYETTFDITFDSPIFITSLEFKDKELFGNWGSQGFIYFDGVEFNPNPGTYVFSRNPVNDGAADSIYRQHEFDINMEISKISFKVSDITNSSQVFIDDIVVRGIGAEIPEPATMILFGSGLLGLMGLKRKERD